MRSFGNPFRHCLQVALALSASLAAAGENPFDDLSSNQPAAPPEEQYYGPDGYLTENRLGEYVEQAKSFLTRNPDSPRSAQATADLLMAAIVVQDGDAQKWARQKLLFDHPRSFAARYAVASFADADACRKFLQTLTESLKHDTSPAKCRQLALAIELSLAAWGAALISEDNFVLECALISHIGLNDPLHELCRAQLAQCEEPARRIAEIAFGDDPPQQKVLKLHEITDRVSARVYERHFYHQLTAEDRDDPAMLRLAAENHLRSVEFARALPLIEQALASERDPQLLYWQGLCLATSSRTDEARHALSSVQQGFPESPWADPAKKLERVLANLDASLDAHAKELFALLEALRGGGLEQFESRSELRLNGVPLVGIYSHVVFPANQAQVVLHKGGKFLLAFRTTNRISHVYFEGEPGILEFQQPPALPVPNARLQRTAEGDYRFSFSASTISSDDGALSLAKNLLLESPVLSSRESFAEMVRHTLVRYGTFPEPVEQAGPATVLRWSRPEIDAPVFRTLGLSVNGDEKKLEMVDAEQRATWNLRYGPAGSFKLDPPEWPDLPTVAREKMDATTFFRLFTLVAQLLEEVQTTPQQ